MLRAYCLSGRPAMGARTWGSFEGWSALIPNALLWLDMEDPTANRSQLVQSNDSEREILLDFLNEFSRAEPHGATVRELLTACAPNNAGTTHRNLGEAIRELCPNRMRDLPTSLVLGKRLSKLKDRVVDGLRLVSDLDPKAKQLRWFVEGRQLDVPF